MMNRGTTDLLGQLVKLSALPVAASLRSSKEEAAGVNTAKILPGPPKRVRFATMNHRRLPREPSSQIISMVLSNTSVRPLGF